MPDHQAIDAGGELIWNDLEERARLLEPRPKYVSKAMAGLAVEEIVRLRAENAKLREASKLAIDCFEEIREHCSDYSEAVLECERGIRALNRGKEASND